MSTTLRNRANWTFGLPRTLHAFGVNIFLLPLGIATSVLIARSIGPGGKGTLDLIIATAALLTMFLGVSLPPGITFAVAQRKAEPKSLAAQLVVVSIVQALLALAVLTVLQATGQLQRFLPSGKWIIAGVVLYVWVDMLAKFWGAILAGRQDIAVVNNSELVGRVTQFLTIFVLFTALYFSGKRLSVGLLFLVTFSATVLINLLLLTSLGFRFQLSSNLGGLKAAFRFALPAYAANTAQFLNYKLDVFVVGFFAGPTSVGRYTLAVSLGQLLWLMSSSVASVLLPKVAAATDVAGSIQHTTRVTRLSFWATAVCGVALGVLASLAIPFVYGEAFRPSVAALLWLLPGIVVFTIANVLAAYIAGVGKPHLNLLVSGVSLIVTIALDLLLIPRLNIVGASIASTVSYSLSVVMLIVIFIRETGASVRQILLPTAEDVRFAIQALEPVLKRLRLRPQRAT